MATAIVEPPKPTTPPTATPPADPKPAPDIEALSNRLKGIKGKKDIKAVLGLKTKADAPPAEATPPANPAVTATPPSKKKSAVKQQPAPVQIDEEKLGEAIARGMKPAEAPQAPAPEKKDEPKLSIVNARRLQILERMAKDNPDLAEIPAKFVLALKAEEEYRKGWLAKNPGKKFDSADPEHEEFFGSNDVNWDEDSYELAREQLIKAEAKAEAEKDMKPRFDQMDAEKRAAAAVPHIMTHRAATAKLFFNDMGKDFEKVLKPTGEIDHEEIGRLINSNESNSLVFPIAQHTEEVSSEIYQIANGLVTYDGNKPIHREIAAFVTGEETKMKGLPSDQQKDAGGNNFATAYDWSKMNKVQRERHWHFTEEHLSAIYAAQQAAKAKKIVVDDDEKFQNRAKKLGLQKVGEQNHPPNGEHKSGEPPTIPPPPPPSPAGVVAPPMAAAKKTENNSLKALSNRLQGIK